MYEQMFYHKDGIKRVTIRDEAIAAKLGPEWGVRPVMPPAPKAAVACPGCQQLEKQLEELKQKAQAKIDAQAEELRSLTADYENMTVAYGGLRKEHAAALATLDAIEAKKQAKAAAKSAAKA